MDRDVKRNIAENAPIENPPEGGAGRDPLQDLSPEACTFEVFQQLNSKTGTLRVQAYAGQRTFPVPDIRVSHPGCRTEIYRAVPVFPGVTSIQPVQFLAVGER